MEVQSGRSPPASAQPALQAWNMMRGLEWDAIPIVCDLLGVSDPESLVYQLIMIRDHGRSEMESV